LVQDTSVSFVKYAQERHDAAVAVGAVMPSGIAQDYNVILSSYEKIQPAIDSGEVTTPLAATQWYARTDPGLYDQLVAAVQHVGAYRREHC